MKITNLTVMRCPEQAQTLLAQLDVDKITEPVILHSVYLNTARLALLNKDADLAEKYFDKLEKISLDNDDKAVREVLLARAECDLLRGKPQAAMRKLNEIPEAEATDSIRQRIHALKSRMY